jgi:arylsulfatase A-like enzyme
MQSGIHDLQINSQPPFRQRLSAANPTDAQPLAKDDRVILSFSIWRAQTKVGSSFRTPTSEVEPPMRFTPFLCGAMIVTTSFLTAQQPNILWLTTEDNGPELGCYGDDYATTPHIDALAAKGLRYSLAWSNAPVCAPARTAIISGMYPPSTGSQHMRSYLPAPTEMEAYPVFLKRAGYYVTNNAKEDYNLSTPEDLWHESSHQAHWQNRPEGSPFFAIFNFTRSHESQVRDRPHQAVHDPAEVKVPPYQPDDPLIRQDWAQFYDVVSEVDVSCGDALAELAAAGLADDTIVFYYGDHGAGIASHKRNAKNRGLHVGLIVYIPEKFAHLRPPEYTVGGSSDRLVSFVDLAPTLLSLIGEQPPEWMQGHAFLGKYTAPPPDYMFGFRGRMDERTDFVRTITDGRYVYVRNFRPDLPAGQVVDYQFQTPGNQRWLELFQAGKTNAVQSAFFLPTPPEQLFDLQQDPHEIDNLARSPEHRAIKDRLSRALFQHMESTMDLGFLPEAELHRRTTGISPYDWARQPGNYDYDRIQLVAAEVTLGQSLSSAKQAAQLRDAEPAVRYWTLRGIGLAAQDDPAAAQAHLPTLRHLLEDQSTDVAITAADLLVRHGVESDQTVALQRLADWANPAGNHFTAIAALTVLDKLGPVAAPVHAVLKSYPLETVNLPHPRYRFDVGKLLTSILGMDSVDPRLK